MKISNINKTYAATAAVLSAIFLSAGCGTDPAGEAQTEPETAKEETAAEEQEGSSGRTEQYDAVLAEYSDMVQNDFYMDLRDSDTYESCFGEHIGFEIRTHKQDIYYAFYDITCTTASNEKEHSQTGIPCLAMRYDFCGFFN